MVVADLFQREQFPRQWHDSLRPARSTDNDIPSVAVAVPPWRHKSFALLFVFSFGRYRKQELTYCTVLRFGARGKFNEIAKRDDIHIEPP